MEWFISDHTTTTYMHWMPAPAPSCGAMPPAAKWRRRPPWSMGWFIWLAGLQCLRVMRQDRLQFVDLQHRWRSILLARRGQWGGLCQFVRLQRLRPECKHRRQAVELLCQQQCGVLLCRGERGRLFHRGRSVARLECQHWRQALGTPD